MCILFNSLSLDFLSVKYCFFPVSRDVVQPNVSYWSVERGLTDYLPVLKKYAYQPACRSPQSPKIKDEVTDNMQIYEAEKVSTISFELLLNIFILAVHFPGLVITVFVISDYCILQIWHKIGVNRDQLDMWTENLRKVRQLASVYADCYCFCNYCGSLMIYLHIFFNVTALVFF